MIDGSPAWQIYRACPLSTDLPPASAQTEAESIIPKVKRMSTKQAASFFWKVYRCRDHLPPRDFSMTLDGHCSYSSPVGMVQPHAVSCRSFQSWSWVALRVATGSGRQTPILRWTGRVTPSK